MNDSQKFCVLGNAMNAKSMGLGEEVSTPALISAALIFFGLIFFILS
ncbi:MAG: hypothetical protein HON14_07945 [Rhodospirillaceae bacterium]|jgi:hypothetical protein|nr:hypothetical protein [Rhodospirillaceae bacterium]MBT4588760.1 hypothetical protein [Rhodospirillaceae bacterium]MBT4939046.1 hypothetical protein [Rhodospirillaceae bacterium]MBT5939500.1 hypothetical protein [Rhodospirillaceae bacterium]MBT7267769.1 hypothetical protein [Rhodospirillaceae bacterium]